MEAIVYQSAPQSRALRTRLLNKVLASDCPQNIKDGLTEYCDAILHPTNGKEAAPIERNGFYWQYIESELTLAEINSIEVLSSDWFPVLEL